MKVPNSKDAPRNTKKGSTRKFCGSCMNELGPGKKSKLLHRPTDQPTDTAQTIWLAPFESNKAVHTATEVACGWAGAVTTKHLGRSGDAKPKKK